MNDNIPTPNPLWALALFVVVVGGGLIYTLYKPAPVREAQPALGAPYMAQQRTIVPETTDMYELGTTSREWLRTFTQTLCLNGDCKSAWPTGGSGVGTSTNPFMATYYVATSTLIASQFPYASTTALSATTLCLTGDTCRTTWPTSGSGGGGNVSTSSVPVLGQLAYWTTTTATPALLSTVATTSHAFSGPFTISGTIGALVGGSNSTVTWNGLATTSQPASSNVIVSNGGAGVYGVATSSLAVSAPITFSGTLGAQLGGSGGSFGCTDASSGVTGCMTATDWAYLHTATTTFSSPLVYTGSTNAVTCPTCQTSAAAWPWNVATNFGSTTNSTTTPTWYKTGLFASSTSELVNLDVWSVLTLKATSSALLATDSIGNLISTTSIGSNFVTGTLGTINTTYPLGGGGALTRGGTLTLTTAFGTTTDTGIGNNLVLYTSAGGVIKGVATSSAGFFAGTQTNGFVLALSGGVPTWVATSSSGGSGAWPFTPSTYGGVANQSTTTPFWLNGTMILASTTFFTQASTTMLTNTGTTWLTGLTSGPLAVDSVGKVYKAATTTYSTGLTYANGAVTCDTASGTVFGCLSAANWQTFNMKVATGSVPTVGQLAFWQGPASLPTLGSVGTTSLGVTGPITFSGTIGAQVGGAGGNFDCTSAAAGTKGCITAADWEAFNMKVATSAAETAGQIPYWTTTGGSPAKLGSVATGTVSAGSSAITVTAGRAAIGGALAIDCATSGSGQNGCLSSTDWSTFNNKQAALSGGVNGMVTAWSGASTIVASGTPAFTAILATSTTATSTFAGPVRVTPSGLNSTYPILFVGTSTASTPLYGAVQGDVIDGEMDFNGVASINIANANAGACASSGYWADGNIVALASDYAFFGFTNSGWTGVGCAMGNARERPESTIISQPTGDMNFELASSSPVAFNWYIASTTNIMKLTGPAGQLMLGTTTPTWGLLTLGTSTKPQLTLSDNNSADNGWFMRWINNTFYMGTSTPTATSTGKAAMSFDASQTGGSLSVGSSTPTFAAANGLVTIGGKAITSGSSTISTGQIQIDGYNTAGSRVCVFVVGTTLTVGSGACTQ
jgi:hypothetical protein